MLFRDYKKFEKFQGLGNDVVLVDGLDCKSPLLVDKELKSRIVESADRSRGIGYDQIMLIVPTDNKECHAKIRIFNGCDGFEAEACGNGTRCVIQYLCEKWSLASVVLDTPSGILRGNMKSGSMVQVDQGTPSFMTETKEMTALDLGPYGMNEVCGYPIEVGNPHLVIFLPNSYPLNSETVNRFGPTLECHHYFPNRANVEFCSVDRALGKINVLMWERGAGRTRACGSGACAVAFAAIKSGVVSNNSVTILMEGGTLVVTLHANGTVRQCGEAKHVYSGIYRN